MATAKKETNVSKVRAYEKAHPTATAKEIAEATGVKLQSVYVIQSVARRKARMKDAEKRGQKAKAIKILAKMKTSPSNTLTISAPAESMLKVVDNVNHPAHYKVGGIETIDFIEAKELGYNLGNVIKYITRANHKGATYEDLCKARWYLNREISKHLGVNNQ